MIHPPYKILSLDPSSTVIGYALVTSQGTLIEAGRITPWSQSIPSCDRIDSMCDHLWELLDEFDPRYILVEWTKGKVGKRHHGLGAGLAVYGCGVGAARSTCKEWICFAHRDRGINRPHPRELITILENDWTRGVPKKDRQIAIASLYPAYHVTDDTGGDIADAIGMADWWLKEHALVNRR